MTCSSVWSSPGGLVEQWQDELFFKSGLRFDLLTNQLIDANVNLNVFETHPLLIARMDQLSRNEQLQAHLVETEWDLIIVDEAHRMGAHYFGGKLEKTKRFQLGELLGRITRHLLPSPTRPNECLWHRYCAANGRLSRQERSRRTVVRSLAMVTADGTTLPDR